MSYKDLNIEKCYETSEKRTHLLEEFYVPMLEETVKYFRIAGFFSSSSLVVAAKGIEGLIHNGGVMKLLISPELSYQDYEIIKKYDQNELTEDCFLFENFNINDFSCNEHLQALAWLLANEKLDIKIVINKRSNNSLFHQKIGIGSDEDGNMISFSGSINESAQAWLNNIEEFKTFKSWEPEQLDYLLSDLRKFNSYWNNEKCEVATVYDLPLSIKNKIINIKPRDILDLSIMKKYQTHKVNENNVLSLFPHQEKAVNTWIENEYSLLFEMATGTGKTRTAIGCIKHILEKQEKLLTIISTPQNTLSKQWKREIEELKIIFDVDKIIDGTNQKWKSDLESLMIELQLGYHDKAIIYTTHDTSSSEKFLKIINDNKKNIKIIFVCDEVHAIGSENQQKALLPIYDYRVGLSATPERMFDEQGTNVIRNYFGNKSFEFTIADALNTINPGTNKPFLNQFYYYPRFVPLSENEMKKYNEYSKKIAYISSLEEPDEEALNIARNNRAKILKNAILKLDELDKVISELMNIGRIKDLIIFSTETQLYDVMNLLEEKGINRCKITEGESTTKKAGVNGLSEREEYINQFRNGNIQVLVGIKCLDEGIDIKNARLAIIMSSSTNPREYVQRVGRVIRPNTNKDYSVIYDFIVRPDELDYSSIKILEKEAKRAYMIAQNAINFNEVKRIFEENGVDGSCL